MEWTLTGVGHPHTIAVAAGKSITIGRATESDILIPDVTVSRLHAELIATEAGIAVRDLGSSNGTAINGARVATGTVLPGDTVAFGTVSYRLPLADPSRPATDPGLEGTVVRQLDLGGGLDALADAPALEHNVQAHQLARVLDVAKRLSGEFELDKLMAAAKVEDVA